MPFVTDNQLLQAVADAMKVSSTSVLPPWFTGIVSRANAAAYQEILGALLVRGFTKAQVDSWDRGAEFQYSQGLFFALRDAGSYESFDPRTLELLDRREELKTVLLFASGEWLRPTEGKPGTVVTGGPEAAGSVFNWPPEDTNDSGETIRW